MIFSPLLLYNKYARVTRQTESGVCEHKKSNNGEKIMKFVFSDGEKLGVYDDRKNSEI